VIVRREIPADMQEAIEAQHTRPVHLVRIEANVPVTLSEGPDIEFDGLMYMRGAVRVWRFHSMPNGEQEGDLYLLNEGKAAAALILIHGIADRGITICQT
jgi:hypothetical protein